MVSIENIEECRWYENEYPNENDLVMCKIVETDDEGSYVELLEYNNICGMILKTLISKKRVKNIRQILKEGNEETVRVVRVDTLKGYIDLSKKDLNAEEIEEFKVTFSKSKQVNTIMKSIAMKLGEKNLESLYKLFCWRFYKDYQHAYEAFKLIST